MRVFLSWSGERSKQVAQLLDTWLKCTIQSLQPWISTRGIGRGELWFPAINRELAETSVGIVCLTRENLNAPWILFESGALAKGLDSNRVITFLIDLETSDIGDPLAQFNHTLPNKDSMFQLLNTVNNLSSAPLEVKIVERVFDKYWDEFERDFNEILKETPLGSKPKKVSNDEMLLQILASVRGMDKRLRFVEGRNEIMREDQNLRNVEFEKLISNLKAQNEFLKRENNKLKHNSIIGLGFDRQQTSDNDDL